MQLSNQFHAFISWNARGSREPIELEEQAHQLTGGAFGEELYDAVQVGSFLSTIQTSARDPELAGEADAIAKLVTEIKPRDPRSTAAAQQILTQVQGALGGVPAAFGMVETDVHDQQPFYVRIHKAQENGGAYQQADPRGVDAVVYVDPKTAAFYVDTKPGDRWTADTGPFNGAASYSGL